ncbi:MAG TPA: succinate--CoA ligase subunit beta, partial [Sedimenticola thiotaurini]|nr:succinate--CoA ligase subunit beta [Sedimenticola thiotaurini]
MNLHEYQSKQLFARHGIPVPAGKAAFSVFEAREAAQALDGERWVVKAQVHAGGRGKAGGVVLVDDLDRVEAEAERLLGSRLVTRQTGSEGLPINALLIEEPTDIGRELYLSALVDRASRRVLF